MPERRLVETIQVTVLRAYSNVDVPMLILLIAHHLGSSGVNCGLNQWIPTRPYTCDYGSYLVAEDGCIFTHAQALAPPCFPMFVGRHLPRVLE